VRFSRLDDDAIVERLTRVTGIGRWTAEMFLIFSMRRPDIFPIADLGIRRGMGRFFEAGDAAAAVERAEVWRPYRTVASLYLWRSVSEVPPA
jgi:3-methyladenine DNA glycosylase/8-oxoguanine DNA glycosylase